MVALVQRVVGPALLYTRDGLEKNEATSAEVENWVKRWNASPAAGKHLL